MTATTASEPVDKASVWEDFIDIFFSPASVFRRREHGSWVLPLIVVTLAIAIVSFASRGVLQPVMDAEFERAAGASSSSAKPLARSSSHRSPPSSLAS
jgi:hypothetical protein